MSDQHDPERFAEDGTLCVCTKRNFVCMHNVTNCSE